jgi:hypothetical protein
LLYMIFAWFFIILCSDIFFLHIILIYFYVFPFESDICLLFRMPVSLHQLEGIAVDDLGKSPHRTVSPWTKTSIYKLVLSLK